MGHIDGIFTSEQEYIDSRDVLERIEELRDIRDACEADGAMIKFDAFEDEFAALVALAEECEGISCDWEYGETLIRSDAFVAYAEDLAMDTGAIDVTSLQWPCNHIDWEAAADELKADYCEVEFDGATYYIRSV